MNRGNFNSKSEHKRKIYCKVADLLNLYLLVAFKTIIEVKSFAYIEITIYKEILLWF